MPTIINQLEQGTKRETLDVKDDFVRHPEKAHRKDNPIARKPSWIRVKAPNSEEYFKTKALMKDLSLTTVCEEAACPNIGECWSQNHATFMIMGEICTRACAFCNVRTGLPDPLESEEPKNVGEATAKLGLSHVVITSVDRDDLSDGGAEHFRQTIEQIRLQAPQTSVEILTPDFLRKDGALAHLLQTPPDVFNHNLETVPSLYRTIRPGSRYFQSLRLLQEAKELVPHIFTKSGLMVGLGETVDELYQVMDDLRTADVDFLTIGQYLQPTVKHASVQEFMPPQTFAKLEEHAYAKGFLMVSASPLTRSSYHAGDDFEKLRAARTRQLKST